MKLKEYADGRTIVGVLKFVYAAIAGGCLLFFFRFIGGGRVAPTDVVVRAMSAATEASVILIYAVVVMVMIFGLAVVAISFGGSAQDSGQSR